MRGKPVLGVRANPPSGYHSTPPYELGATITTATLKIGGLLYAVGALLHAWAEQHPRTGGSP